MIFQSPFQTRLFYNSISLSVTSRDQVTYYFLKSLLSNELQPGLYRHPSWLPRPVTLGNFEYHLDLAPSNTDKYRDLSCPCCLQNDGFKRQDLLQKKTISISLLRISVLLFTVRKHFITKRSHSYSRLKQTRKYTGLVYKDCIICK